MDEVVEKLIGGISEEVKQIKKMVQDTERHVKSDPIVWSNRSAMAQRLEDASLLGEEPQNEISEF